MLHMSLEIQMEVSTEIATSEGMIFLLQNMIHQALNNKQASRSGEIYRSRLFPCNGNESDGDSNQAPPQRRAKKAAREARVIYSHK
jgi:hypothetical protein